VYVLASLARNLLAGLRLAFLLPVRSLDFRVDAAQLVLITFLSAVIDVGTDYLRAGPGPSFSITGLYGEIYAFGLLLLTAAVLAMARRLPSLLLSVPIIVLAAFPAIQLAHLIPWALKSVLEPFPFVLGAFDDFMYLWMAIVCVRAVYIALEGRGIWRWLVALAGGALVYAPILFGPLVGPLDAWWQAADAPPPGGMSPASEAVLAAQDFLLDHALDALEESRPGRADLYFVGFAPDSRRDGFRLDVEAAQQVMDERWDTGNRSLVLANNAATVAQHPFATLTYLRKTLNELGDIIDPDEDVVMVYLTGSAGADHALAAVHPPLDLVALTPQGLSQLLDAAGIRFRVIVVSTCYAGAWLEPLKDDESAVIVSSPADVASTDCRGSSEPTSFGTAFFTKGMRRADTLPAAFKIAQESLGAKAPKPEMWIGPTIAARLKALGRGGGSIGTPAVFRHRDRGPIGTNTSFQPRHRDRFIGLAGLRRLRGN